MIFQFPIKFGKNNNNKYVKKEDCHEAQEKLKEFIMTLFNQRFYDLNLRIDDLKNRIEDLKDFVLKKK